MDSDLQNDLDRPTAGPVALDFPAIEAMQEAAELAGWQCEYRQLDAGRLKARSVLSEVDDVSFLRESANRRLGIVGETPAHAVTVIVPASSARFQVNGIDVGYNTVVVVPVRTDLRALSDPGADAFSMHIPSDVFQDCLIAASGNPESRLTAGAQSFRSDTDAVQGFRKAVTGQFGADWLLVDLLRQMRAHNGIRLSLRQARARRVVDKALEHIDANLGDNIRVVDLCQISGVSLSTLERGFRRELQMTPIAYIRARRLDAVRRALIQGDPNTPIAQLAHDYGISHMGRFSADYRRQFGVLPSEHRHR